ncbi:MAG: sigma-70 family RNA polymerase sigma factor [Bacillota bacterium]
MTERSIDGILAEIETSAVMSIETLYGMYANDVLRVCYFYLNDRSLAEEVCQDAFVRLMTSRTQLTPGHEKAWLFKVALNRCRDLWRSGWVRRVVLGSPAFELVPAEDARERRDDEDAMMAAVHRLPAQFREVILLFYYQNYGISEIAGILSLPEGTISSRLSRAREKLKVILEGGDA